MIGTHRERAAYRKLGNPPGFEFYLYRCIGTDAVLYRGGVPRTLKSGPRKGKKTWVGCASLECVVTESEAAAERKRYETETGNCGACMGKGQEWWGWSATDGDDYRPCRTCNETGRTADPSHPLPGSEQSKSRDEP